MIDDMSSAADYLPLTDVDVATTTIIKTKKKQNKTQTPSKENKEDFQVQLSRKLLTFRITERFC